MKKLLLSYCVLSILFLYSVALGTYTGKSSETESTSSGNSLIATYEDDLLSVDIKDVALGEVLEKLSYETGILFSFPPVIGEERVMVRFSDFKIADALNKILYSHDRVFIYEETPSDSDESPPSRLKEVRIYTSPPQGTTKGGKSESPKVINSKSSQPNQKAENDNSGRKSSKRSPARRSGKQTVASLADDLKNSDYSVRLDAIRNLRNIGNADAIGHLTSALEDKNPQVREAAENAIRELQEEGTDTNENEETTPIEGAPTIDVAVLNNDSGNIDLGFNLSSVEEPLITAGLWIEYDPSQMSLVSAEINSGDGAWDTGMSQTVKDPKGPGTYMITAGNLSTVDPDDSSTIGVASVQFQCLTGNCSGQTISVGTVPGFDSVVGNSSGVYDSKINPTTYSIP
jgi:hypothetical protein